MICENTKSVKAAGNDGQLIPIVPETYTRQTGQIRTYGDIMKALGEKIHHVFANYNKNSWFISISTETEELCFGYTRQKD